MMFGKFGTTLALAVLATAPVWAQQSVRAPHEQMHMQRHGEMQMVEPVYPQLGRAQERSAEKLFTLDDARRLAAASNPTLRQAEAEIRAAKARTQQAGLYPNPSVGYTGDEIRGGSVNGGKQGFFVEQSVVTGGKLGKARAVFEQEERVAELEAQEQKTRVETSVKIAFYRVLAAQELLELRRDLSQIGQMVQESEDELARTGQFDETEQLQTQIEVKRLHLADLEQENVLREQWRRLAAVIGEPDLPQAAVAGDLEHGWPEINEEQILETIANLSPAVGIADASAARANAEIARAKSQVIPDINALGGLEYNNEPLGSVPPHAIGWEGLAELSVQLPIFNRNQGNIAEARADFDRAQLEKQRVQLLLRERAASLLDQYATARVVATQYREQILPLAKQANTLMTEKYGQMLAAYPRMLGARRKHFELATEYVQTLETVWATSLALQGFLLTDGLAEPASASEFPHAAGEINPLSSTRTLMPAEQMPLP
ncbi:MAG TPA: TolC family protein [Verrucomicrobiae bacterium]|nr:TolC family protein [Verrucomicrobiae bacterium]